MRKKDRNHEPVSRLDAEHADLVRLSELLPKLIIDNTGDIKREALIRGMIVREYALIDVGLAHLLFLYFFGVSQAELEGTIESGRLLLFYELVENVPLVRKLGLLRTVLEVPRAVCTKVQRINEARNAVAHVAFAALSSRRTLRYGKDHLLTENAGRRFVSDVSCVNEFLNDMCMRLYKGKVEFKHHGQQITVYETYGALMPSAWSCAPIAVSAGKTRAGESEDRSK